MRSNRGVPVVRKSSLVGAALVGVAAVAGWPAGLVGVARAGGPGQAPVGRAEGRAVSATLFGRPVDFGASKAAREWRDGRVVVSAEGVGTSVLADRTTSAAELGAPGGGRRCATPAPGLLALPGVSTLPAVEAGAACGEADAAGDAGVFRATGTGGGTSLGVAVPAVLRDGLAGLRSVPDPAALPLGLGALLPGRSLDGLLDQIGKSELARVSFGTSTSRTVNDPTGFLSDSLAHGGTIDLLPGLLGAAGPLARISVSDSGASVRVDRGAERAVARVTNPVVRIESPVLDQLGLSGLPGLLPGGAVAGLIGPAAATDPAQAGGALSTAGASGFVELRPGQRLSLLCQGPLTMLCTEVAVAPAQGPSSTADGRTAVSAATVSVRMLQVPAAGGIELVTGAAQAEAGPAGAAGPVAAAASGADGAGRILAAGLESAAPSPAASAGPGSASAGAPASPAGGASGAGTLPRTGGLPFNPALVPAALLGSVGLAASRLRLGRA
jgi:hypothetical protein